MSAKPYDGGLPKLLEGGNGDFPRLLEDEENDGLEKLEDIEDFPKLLEDDDHDGFEKLEDGFPKLLELPPRHELPRRQSPTNGGKGKTIDVSTIKS